MISQVKNNENEIKDIKVPSTNRFQLLQQMVLQFNTKQSWQILQIPNLFFCCTCVQFKFLFLHLCRKMVHINKEIYFVLVRVIYNI